MELVPPQEKLNDTEPVGSVQPPPGYTPMTSHSFPPKSRAVVESSNAHVPPPVPEDYENPKVVIAPITHGRSFNLRWSYNRRYSTGQMLVLMDREHYGAPYELLETFFPEKNDTSGQRRDRFFLGDRKLGKRFLAGIMEIRTARGEPMKFRMLYPSGQQIHDWKILDLARLRLRTTEEQRAHITAFTGVIYKVQERKHNPSKRSGHSSAAFNRALDDKAAKDLKKKLKK